MGRLDGFDYYYEDSGSEDESQFTSPNHTDPRRKCPVCVYPLITEYNMLTNAFQSVGLAYQIPVDSPCHAGCMLKGIFHLDNHQDEIEEFTGSVKLRIIHANNG